jgi:hypothetical protein
MKTYTADEWIEEATLEDDVYWREADGSDVEIVVESGAPRRRYGLCGDAAGAITVYGDGNGDAYRKGNGNGSAYRGGIGEGSAYRYGSGEGGAYRVGSGEGSAYRYGSGEGGAYRYGSGEGSAYRYGSGEGGAYRVGSGEGGAYRVGSGCAGSTRGDVVASQAAKPHEITWQDARKPIREAVYLELYNAMGVAQRATTGCADLGLQRLSARQLMLADAYSAAIDILRDAERASEDSE